MNYGIFNNMHPAGKLFLAIFLMVGSFLIIGFFSSLLAIAIFHVPLNDMLEMISSGDYSGNIGLIKYLQINYSISLFLIPAILTGFFIHGRAFHFLRADVPPSALTVIYVVILAAGSLPLINYLVDFNLNLSLPEKFSGLQDKIRNTENIAEEMMKDFLSDTSVSGLFVNILMIAVVPAMGEEFLFRGVLQRLFTEWFRNSHLAIILTAILFSFMHFQFLGLIPRIFLGVLFGYLFFWSGSVWIPVIAHFLNNIMAVIFYYLYNKGLFDYDLDTVGSTEGTEFYTLISVFVLMLILSMIYLKERRSVS